MTEFIAILLITILTAVSPGADFAMITKNSYLYGRSIGMLTNIGISAGVLFHVTYTLLAVTVILAVAPDLFIVVKVLGAIYLIFMGYKTFKQKPLVALDTTNGMSRKKAFSYGFLCSATNPKTMLLVISAYTQIASPNTPQLALIGYGVFMSLTFFVWYVFVVGVFTQQSIREKMLKKQVAINRAIGSILGLLGGTLLFSSM